MLPSVALNGSFLSFSEHATDRLPVFVVKKILD